MSVFFYNLNDSFDQMCGELETIKNSEVVFLCIYENLAQWCSAAFKLSDSNIEKKQEELLHLENILLKNNIQFYFIVGSEYNSKYDFLINETIDLFHVLFFPTAILSLEYDGLINNYNSNISEIEIENVFKKLFINYNNKATEHRCIFMDKLCEYNLLDFGLFSWNDDSKNYKCKSNDAPYEFKCWNEIKTKVDDFNYIITNEYRDNLLKMNCFLSTVTETSVDFIFITEKTYRQFLIKQPFVCIAAPNHHSTLKKMGFELYDEIIDYSFDNEINTEKRIEMIIHNMKFLKDKNYKNLIKQIKEKLDYNKARAIEVVDNGLFIPEKLMELCNSFIKENNFENLFNQNLKKIKLPSHTKNVYNQYVRRK